MNLQWNKIEIIENSNPKFLEHRNCPICGENKYKLLDKMENFQFFSDDENKAKQVDITNVQCKKCFAVYMNPCFSKEGFMTLFEQAGMSYGSSEGRPDEQVNWLEKYDLLKESSTVFDIGCGVGNFLSSLPNDMKKVGVDIDKASIDLAKQKYKDIEFICSSFEELTYDNKIDLITMYHVLEHLTTPKETLNRLYELSNEKTRLVIEVPIIENGLTNDINGFFGVQHLTHFSRKSFKNILNSSGWEIIEWLEQEEYNGCRVLARKGKKEEINCDFSPNERINVYRYFSKWYESLVTAEEKILNLKKEFYVIWGGGLHTEFLYQLTSLFNQDKKFIIIDSDKNKQNKKYRGINIYSPEMLKELDTNTEIIISSYGSQDRIEKYIKSIRNDVKTIKIYDYLRIY